MNKQKRVDISVRPSFITILNKYREGDADKILDTFANTNQI